MRDRRGSDSSDGESSWETFGAFADACVGEGVWLIAAGPGAGLGVEDGAGC